MARIGICFCRGRIQGHCIKFGLRGHQKMFKKRGRRGTLYLFVNQELEKTVWRLLRMRRRKGTLWLSLGLTVEFHVWGGRQLTSGSFVGQGGHTALFQPMWFKWKSTSGNTKVFLILKKTTVLSSRPKQVAYGFVPSTLCSLPRKRHWTMDGWTTQWCVSLKQTGLDKRWFKFSGIFPYRGGVSSSRSWVWSGLRDGVTSVRL